MAKEQKTNVMRILDKAHIPYAEHTYDSKDGAIDGMSVASKLHQNVNQVFKTLVTQGPPSKPPPSPPKIFDLIESLFNGFSCLPKKGSEGEGAVMGCDCFISTAY